MCCEAIMRTQIRIVAGSLKGRKLTCIVAPELRPLPDRVREALFNILSNSVVDRPFYDLFAGTGAVGLEALSRGASRVELIERDGRAAGDIGRILESWGVAGEARAHRADVYRWAERWQSPGEPATVFLGPPYPDYQRRLDELMRLIGQMQEKLAPGSTLILQSEKSFDAGALPQPQAWEHRQYGRTRLSIWFKDYVGAGIRD
jgi:16S rRNA (guanine(966)-N(2))-methyltransferase RsmD